MEDKQQALEKEIRGLGDAVVAFSGGTDSTFLLAMCRRILGPENVLAVTADSATLPRSELRETIALAAEIGVEHLVAPTDELHDADFVKNGADRCYFCKRDLFTVLHRVAEGRGFRHLVYGATADDLGDYRPGMRAGQEAGAVAPLLLAGFTKVDVRAASRALGLRTWNKPAAACLSSRVPYGTPISTDALAQVERAEEFLRCELGFRQVRVRHHGRVARIEVPAEDLARLVQEPARAMASAYLRQVGFTYITVDLQGFRSGSMNEVLGATEAPATANATATTV
jgi:pyridinium-3,5-biscarboxylic acid mononucleotide sulfurtransferase